MGTAVGDTLPLAVGVAISPLAIIAVILLLVTPRGGVTGPAYLLGWLLGLSVVGTVVLLVAEPAGASSSDSPATWVSILQLALGVSLFAVAVQQWRGRPDDGGEPHAPKWMGAVDSFTAGRALVLGALFSGVKPKNLLLTIGAASLIAEAGLAGGQAALALGIYVALASIGIAVPMVIYVAMGTGARAVLEGIKEWMIRHNAAIMTVLCIVFGTVLVGDAIGGLGG
jgi:hypothetical protein